MMELFKICKHLKTQLCRPRKRAPYWPLTTNYVRKFLINPKKVLVEKQRTIKFTDYLAEEEYSLAAFLM
jgi:hypothetical protein